MMCFLFWWHGENSDKKVNTKEVLEHISFLFFFTLNTCSIWHGKELFPSHSKTVLLFRQKQYFQQRKRQQQQQQQMAGVELFCGQNSGEHQTNQRSLDILCFHNLSAVSAQDCTSDFSCGKCIRNFERKVTWCIFSSRFCLSLKYFKQAIMLNHMDQTIILMLHLN